jgi:GNAT superfamily N-acetyltransferase
MMTEVIPIRIELATHELDHHQAFVELSRESAKEGMPGVEFDETAVLAFYKSNVPEDRRSRNAWLAKKGDEYIGYIFGYIDRYPHSWEPMAFMAYLYVAPAHRGTWTAIKLIKRFEEWARLAGVRYIYLGVARLQKDEAKHIRRLFPQLGYEWCGSNFVKGF